MSENKRGGFLEITFSAGRNRYWQTYLNQINQETYEKLLDVTDGEPGYDSFLEYCDANANPLESTPILISDSPDMSLRLLDENKEVVQEYKDEDGKNIYDTVNLKPYLTDLSSDIKIGECCVKNQYAQQVYKTLKDALREEIAPDMFLPYLFINIIGDEAAATSQVDSYDHSNNIKVRVLIPIEWTGEFDFNDLYFFGQAPEQWPGIFEDARFDSECMLVDSIIYKDSLYVWNGADGVLNSEDQDYYNPPVDDDNLPDLDELRDERYEFYGLVTAEELEAGCSEYSEYDED